MATPFFPTPALNGRPKVLRWADSNNEDADDLLLDDNAHDVDDTVGDNGFNICASASYIDMARRSPPSSDPSPSRGARQAPLPEVQGPSRRNDRRRQHPAQKTCRRVPKLVVGLPHRGRPSRHASPRLNHVTLDAHGGRLQAAFPSTCASTRGRKPLPVFPSTSTLMARWASASLCTYASSRECLLPSRVNPTAMACPRQTPRDGVKSFPARSPEPRGRTPRHLSSTLLRGVAFRRSSTDVASTVCPTITAEPPALVPCGVCATSTFTTSPGTASVHASHQPTQLLSGLSAPRGVRCAAAMRSSLQACLAAPTQRLPC
jgi:hypothetical protein